MLELLGLAADPEALYRAMLEDFGRDLGSIGEALGWDEERIREALDELARLSLIRPSWEHAGTLRPISPELGFAALLARQESELLEQQRRIVDVRSAVAALVAQYTSVRSMWSSEEMEQLVGLDAVRLRLEELAHGCREEICSFMPGAMTAESMAAGEPLNQACLDRGVVMRDVFLDSVRNDPATVAQVARFTEAGLQVRTVAALPLRMTIYDRRHALIPIDPDRSSAGAILHSGPGVVAVAHALFEQVWRQAKPLGRERERDETGLTDQERELLRMLSAGHTDEVVARKLGVSVRTSRRITAELMERLSARSRFQAGVHAARKGWI